MHFYGQAGSCLVMKMNDGAIQDYFSSFIGIFDAFSKILIEFFFVFCWESIRN